MRSMRAWLENYEERRTDPYSNPKKLLSSRFDLESMSWDEIRDIPIPELGEGMTYGKSFEALRKSWFAYRVSRKGGLPAPDLAVRILKLQKGLGLPLSDFPELERYGGSDFIKDELSDWSESSNESEEEMSEEVSEEELILKHEERMEAIADLGIGPHESEEEDNEW